LTVAFSQGIIFPFRQTFLSVFNFSSPNFLPGLAILGYWAGRQG